MYLSNSQMKYGTAFKDPNRSSIFDKPADASMTENKDWDVKADLRMNSQREKTRRNINIKYSNRNLSPLNRTTNENHSKFVQSNVIKPMNKLISSQGSWNGDEVPRPIN